MRNKHFADITQYKQEHQHRTINTKKNAIVLVYCPVSPALKPIKFTGLGAMHHA